MVPVLKYPKQTLTVQLVFGNNSSPSDLTKTRQVIEKLRPDYYAPAALITRSELKRRLVTESNAFYSKKLEEALPPNFTHVEVTGAENAFLSAQRQMIIDFNLRTIPFDVRTLSENRHIDALFVGADSLKKRALEAMYDRKNEVALQDAWNFAATYDIVCSQREKVMLSNMANYLGFAQKFYPDTKFDPEIRVVAHSPLMNLPLQAKAEKLAQENPKIIVLPAIIEDGKLNPIGSLLFELRKAIDGGAGFGDKVVKDLSQRILSIHFTR